MMGLLANIDLEHQIINLATNTVLIGSIVMIVAVIIAALTKNKFPKLKLPLFITIAGTMAGVTLFLLSSTVYLNVKSESGGPVHWHADFEFWACDTEIELRNPSAFLSNKIGSSSYHEHNDKRIHLEGVVVDKSVDASLGKFMSLTGGYVTDSSVGIPLNDDSNAWYAPHEHNDGDKQDLGAADLLATLVSTTPDGKVLELKDGPGCNNQLAQVQAFVYRYNKEDDTYSQSKLTNPADYIMRDEAIVPPGDCVIVEFDVPKDRTDKLCQQYGVRDTVRCVEFGVKEWTSDLCNITEVPANAVDEVIIKEYDYSLCDEVFEVALDYCPVPSAENGVLN